MTNAWSTAPHTETGPGSASPANRCPAGEQPDRVLVGPTEEENRIEAGTKLGRSRAADLAVVAAATGREKREESTRIVRVADAAPRPGGPRDQLADGKATAILESKLHCRPADRTDADRLTGIRIDQAPASGRLNEVEVHETTLKRSAGGGKAWRRSRKQACPAPALPRRRKSVESRRPVLEPANRLGHRLVRDARARSDQVVRVPEPTQFRGLGSDRLVPRRIRNLNKISLNRRPDEGANAIVPGPPSHRLKLLKTNN